MCLPWLVFRESPSVHFFFLGINDVLTPRIFSSSLLENGQHSALGLSCHFVLSICDKPEVWKHYSLIRGTPSRGSDNKPFAGDHPVKSLRQQKCWLRASESWGHRGEMANTTYHPEIKSRLWRGYGERRYLIPLILLSQLLPTTPIHKLSIRHLGKCGGV